MSIYGNRLRTVEPTQLPRDARPLQGVSKIPGRIGSAPLKQLPVEIQVDLEASGEDILTLAEIIHEKPKPKVVREFMRAQLASIKSPEEQMFDPSG